MNAFKCEMCGGRLMINNDYTTCTCDHCGRTVPIPDGMKSFADKMEAGVRKKQTEESEIRSRSLEEEDQRREEFTNGSFSKVIAAFFCICVFSLYISFRLGRLGMGFVALAQTVLFGFSWLMGMQIVEEKKKGLHTVLAVLGLLLILLFFCIEDIL